MHQHIRTTDIFEHANALSGWQQRYDQLSSGRFQGGLSLAEVQGVCVFRERLNQSAVQHMHLPEHALNVILPLAWPHTDEQHDLSALHPSVLPDQPEFRIVSPVGMDVVCVSIAHTELHQWLGEEVLRRRRVKGGLQAVNLAPALTGQAAQILLTLLESPLTPAEEQRVQEEIILLAGDWLEALDAEPSAPLNHSTRRYIVNRCHEWLLDEPDHSPSVLELCKRLKISRRTLQYSFQSIASVTPVQYLRSVRLNGARRAMQQSPQTSIADIAARWGFTHSSYFSLEYQKLFGERPSASRGQGACVVGHP